MSDHVILRAGLGFMVYRAGSGGSIEIFDIHVESVARRTGVGRLLVDKLIKVCEAEGVKRIYAITRAENRIAQEFYVELNFRPTPLFDFYGTRTADGHTTIDAIMFVRDLEQYP